MELIPLKEPLPQHKVISLERVVQQPGLDLETLQCSLCKNLLWDGLNCINLSKNFCRACITSYEEENRGNCICGEQFIPRPLSNDLLETLSKITCYCRYSDQGCEEKLWYSSLNEHEENCVYGVLANTNHSIISESKASLKRSIGLVLCEHCGKEIERAALNSHLQACPEMVIKCPKCSMKVTRKEIEHHDCVKYLTYLLQNLIYDNKDMKVKVQKKDQQIKSRNQSIRRISGEMIKLKMAIKRLAKESEEQENALEIFMPKCKKCHHVAVYPEVQKLKGENSGTCLPTCENCNKRVLCQNCFQVCASCGKTQGECCVHTEKECNGVLCKICFKTCSTCGYLFCPNCISYCTNCYELLCLKDREDHCSIMYLLKKDKLIFYDFKTGKYTTTMNRLEPKLNCVVGTARISNKIYYSGGDTDRKTILLARTGCLQFSTDFVLTHTKLADMVLPKVNNTLVPIDNTAILSIGGHNRTALLSYCELYNIKTNTWKLACKLQWPRNLAGVCNIEQKFIFVFGSANECAVPIERLDLTKGLGNWTWTPISFNNSAGWVPEDGCNTAVGLNSDEILLLSKQGYSFTYSISSNDINYKEEIGTNKRFCQTSPLVLLSSTPKIHVFEFNAGSIVTYSTGERKWAEEL